MATLRTPRTSIMLHPAHSLSPRFESAGDALAASVSVLAALVKAGAGRRQLQPTTQTNGGEHAEEIG